MTALNVAGTTEAVAVAWLRAEWRFVQALLIAAPLSSGGMMLIGERGEIEGSITGGCVEGAVVTEAEAILAGERRAGGLTYGISDDLAGSVGLTCGGTVHIFIQELTLCGGGGRAGSAHRASGGTAGSGRHVARRSVGRRESRDHRSRGDRLTALRPPGAVRPQGAEDLRHLPPRRRRRDRRAAAGDRRDVVTSAGQIIDSYRRLRGLGAQITVARCVIDRGARGVANLAAESGELRCLLTIDELRAPTASEVTAPVTRAHES